MGFLLAIWRRLFGGADSKWTVLTKRGVQCILLVLVVFLYRRFVLWNGWIRSLLVGICTYLFFCKGHYYYFLCGTESDEYINEQEAKGRKPAMDWIVSPVNKWLGFAPRSTEYCFIGMFLRYTLWSIPLALVANPSCFMVGLSVAFVYNACFWVQFPAKWKMNSPTNWAEYITGGLLGISLLF